MTWALVGGGGLGSAPEEIQERKFLVAGDGLQHKGESFIHSQTHLLEEHHVWTRGWVAGIPK